jgi:hypothetical protein
MDKTALIEKFCDAVNAGLQQHENRADSVYAELKRDVEDDQDLLDILDDLREVFTAAYQPQQFETTRIMELGLHFDQCYALLSAILDADILDPKEAFAQAITADLEPGEVNTYALIGRFWTVSGTQTYDVGGQLVHFTYDPLTTTTSVAAAITGDYIPLNKTPGAGIGAVGQAASRAAMRGSGHGKHVSDAFEAEMKQIASARGEELKLLILESEAGAREFWSRRGYRWPSGVRYVQPPIEFDLTTGEPLLKPVPELLMVKPVADSQEIDRHLLVDAVESMYRQWYLPEAESDAASARIESLVMGDLFGEFLASLPPEGEPIRLEMPPLQ